MRLSHLSVPAYQARCEHEKIKKTHKQGCSPHKEKVVGDVWLELCDVRQNFV